MSNRNSFIPATLIFYNDRYRGASKRMNIKFMQIYLYYIIYTNIDEPAGLKWIKN